MREAALESGVTVVFTPLAALLFVTIICYALAFTAVVLFYVFYTQPDDCTEHKVFISLNFIFCIVVSVVAILPKVQVINLPINQNLHV